MAEQFTKGVAFIMEGDTEKVFYLVLLEWLCKKHSNYTLRKDADPSTGERYYVLENGNNRVLVKMNPVGTISQITNSASWFESRCYGEHKSIPWAAVLCYDTDGYQEPITKFYEGDWKELRKRLKKKAKEIIDMAAAADIEDTMLLDESSIFSYLGIEPVPIPSGSKGKRRMKKLFRLKGQGCAYHEGTRAAQLIQSLDFNVIISQSPLPFEDLEKTCFPE